MASAAQHAGRVTSSATGGATGGSLARGKTFGQPTKRGATVHRRMATEKEAKKSREECGPYKTFLSMLTCFSVLTTTVSKTVKGQYVTRTETEFQCHCKGCRKSKDSTLFRSPYQLYTHLTETGAVVSHECCVPDCGELVPEHKLSQHLADHHHITDLGKSPQYCSTCDAYDRKPHQVHSHCCKCMGTTGGSFYDAKNHATKCGIKMCYGCYHTFPTEMSRRQHSEACRANIRHQQVNGKLAVSQPSGPPAAAAPSTAAGILRSETGCGWGSENLIEENPCPDENPCGSFDCFRCSGTV